MRILAIESSCDETAAAVVEDGRNVLSSVVASQVEEHKLYGGVVPEEAPFTCTETPGKGSPSEVTVPVTRFSCCASAYTTLPAESNRNATNKRK